MSGASASNQIVEASRGATVAASLTPRRLALGVLCLILSIEVFVAVFYRENDVGNHYWNGRRWLERVEKDLSVYWYIPYPPARSVLNMLIAWLPYRAARAACVLMALWVLWRVLRTWNRWFEERQPGGEGLSFTASLLTLGLLYPYVIRDLDDCGLQILLLGMLTAVAWLMKSERDGREWNRGRGALGGIALGVAVIYKATPLLVLPYLAARRKWGMIAIALVVIAALMASPALILGWEQAIELNARFIHLAMASSRLGNPSENGFEPPKHQNQGLVIALARAFQHYPMGHPLYVDHPLFIQGPGFAPIVADRIVKGIVLCLLAWTAYRLLQREAEGQESAWAAMCILVAILSPMCWLQHLVLAIPAALRAVRHYLVTRDRWTGVALLLVAGIVLGLQRDIVGRDLSIVVLSYKVDTLVALILLGQSLRSLGQPATMTRATTESEDPVPLVHAA